MEISKVLADGERIPLSPNIPIPPVWKTLNGDVHFFHFQPDIPFLGKFG